MRYFYIFLIGIFLTFIATGCNANDPINMEKFISENKADSIKIVDGTRGSYINIENAEELEEIYQYFSSLKLKPSNTDDLKGFEYSLSFMKDHSTAHELIIIGNILKIDGKYYESEKQINTDLLKQFLIKK